MLPFLGGVPDVSVAFLGVPFRGVPLTGVSDGAILAVVGVRGALREGVPGTASADWLGEGMARSLLTRFLNCDLVSSSPGRIDFSALVGVAGGRGDEGGE